jgi:Domain of unknown function (DUF4157)
MGKSSHTTQERQPATAAHESQQRQLGPMTPQVAQRQALGQALQMKRDAETARNFPGGIPQRMNTLPRKDEKSAQGLSPGMQPKMEAALGEDLSSVKVHTESAEAKEMGAHAFTQGEDIHFAPGQYDEGSQKGQELIGHEMAHVKQQRQGRVQATVQKKGVGINDDSGLEKEADELGKKAAQGKAMSSPVAAQAGGSVGNAAPVQMAVNPTAEDYKDYKTISAMIVEEFDAYAQAQADWHASTKLKDTEVDKLRAILAFVREPDVLAGLQGLTVKGIQAQIAALGEANVFTYLRHYGKAVQGDPFLLPNAADAAGAVKSGKSLDLLKAGFPDWVLNSALFADDFNYIRDHNAEADLIDYYKTSKPEPYFQAQGGTDFNSYLWMKFVDLRSPKSYNAPPISGKIRNYHRFEARALDQIKLNYADKTKTRPLLLILHTALSHNSAFHRETEFSDLVTDKTNNVIMIEGKEKLSDFKPDIDQIAKDYGQNNKIDQVMMAGHGNANIIELAGKVEEDIGTHKLKESSELLDPAGNKTESDKLLLAVMDNMDKTGDAGTPQLHNRIMYNACLTASHDLSGETFDANPATARTEISTYLSTPQNLNDYTDSFAKTNKNDAVKSVGSVASFSRAKYLNGAGGLDLISALDPKLTAPKIEYVEEGVEALGALRAVLECWALDEANCKTAMNKRIAKPVANWDGVIIQELYAQVIGKYWSDANKINTMAGIAGSISEMKSEPHCRVKEAGYWPSSEPAIINPLFTALMGSTDWGASDHIPLVMYQAWLAATDATQSNAVVEKASKDTKAGTAKTAKTAADAALTTAQADLTKAEAAVASSHLAEAGLKKHASKKKKEAAAEAIKLAEAARDIAKAACTKADTDAKAAAALEKAATTEAADAGTAVFSATLDHSSKRGALLAHLEAKFTCNTAKKYVDVTYLDNNSFFPFLLAGPPTKGKLMLALIGYDDSAQADCEAYLLSQLVGDVFPAALGANALLDHLSTEDEILIKLGKKSAPPKVGSSSVVVASGKDANLPLKGAAQNTEWVQSVTVNGESQADGVNVYQEQAHTTVVGTLKKGQRVHILGNLTNDWAIEFSYTSGKTKTRGTAFVEKSQVTQVK